MKRVPYSAEPRRLTQSAVTADEQAVAALLSLLPDPTPDRPFLERVWRGLHRRSRRGFETWRWAAVASALAACVMVGMLVGSRIAVRPRAQMLLVEGRVVTGAAGMTWTPARAGDQLRANALVENDASGTSLVRLPAVATLLARSSTRLELQASADSSLVHLFDGTVTLRVTKRPSEHPFTVRVGRYTVTVVGTLFSVSENPDGRVEVNVAEGAVRVADGHMEWRVSAGESWSSDAPNQRAVDEHTAAFGPLLSAAMNGEPDGQLSELLHALPRTPEASASKKALVAPLAGAAPAAQFGESAAPITAPSVVPTREAPVHRTRRASEPERFAVLDHPTVVERPAVVEPAPTPLISQKTEAVESTAAPVPLPAPAPVAGPDPYSEALALERRGEHRLAASKLQAALASNVGPRDLELYHLALLRQRHLDDPRGALEALLSYRASFPSGGLRQEVDVSIIESRLALKQTDQALAESAAFLSKYPQNERADEMHFMRGDLLRQRGDCAGALAEYHAVLRGPAVDDALYYAAYCVGELGQPDVATTALKDYLRRFPNGKHAGAARQTVGE
jgi:hypothetical protein